MRYTRDQLVEMARKLLACEYHEDHEKDVIDILETESGDDMILDYLYYSDPPLSAEDAVDLALKIRDVKWTRFVPK